MNTPSDFNSAAINIFAISSCIKSIARSFWFVLGACFLLNASGLMGQTQIAKWTFEVSAPTTGGPLSPEEGTGTATSNTGGTFSTPAGWGSARSWSSTHYNVGEYFQFVTSSTGLQGLSVSWQQTGSNTGPKNFDLAYSLNGTDFTQFGTYLVTNDGWNASETPVASSKYFDLSSVTTIDNAATVYFRLRVMDTVSIGDGTVALGGTGRIDNFTVMAASSASGTPTITSPADSETAVFTTTYGTASNVQTFPVAGSSLTAAITATAPAGFEVSSNGTSWDSTATFTPTSGAVSGATLSMRLAATAPVAGTYNDVDITLASAGAGTVTLTTPVGGNSVSPATLEVTASDVVKPFGDTLAEVNPGSTAFTSTGLVNAETIGSVTITYLDGFEAADAAMVYTDAAVPSAATGDSFTAGNYTITYVPGDLTVTNDPIVQISGSLTAMTSVYGIASAAQSFTVSGTSLTADLVVTAPTGYQVSASVDSGFAAAVALTPVSGTVSTTTLYVRLRADIPTGAVAAGNVTAESTDAVTQNLPVPAGTVTAKALTITGLTGDDKIYDRTTDGSFTGTPVLNGVVAGDEADVELDDDTLTATFAQAAAGTGLNLALTGFALSGTKAGNYSVTQPVLTADIDPKQLTLLNPAVVNRAFNGGTAATITGTLDGVIDPDVVTFTGTGIFDNAGPGAPIAVTAGIVLTGADAGNYTMAQPTGLSGRIMGSATGATIAQWLFNGDSATTVPGGFPSPTTTVGTGTAALVGGTTATFVSGIANGGSSDLTAGSPPNYGWNIATFAAQGADNKTRGIQFNVSTAGSQGIQMRYDLRASNTGSRFVQVQYTLNGTDWIDFGAAQAVATAGETWFNGNNIDFTSISGADNNPNFGVRILAAFDPEGSGYATANTGSTYGPAGTWRFDRVEFTGNPPFHFVSSTPAHGTTNAAPSSAIQLTFTRPALLTENAVTLVDEDSNDIAFTGLPVTEAASVVILTPVSPLPYGKNITVTLVRDEITSGVDTLESTTATIPVTFTTEAAVTPVVEVTPASVEVPINTIATLTANVTAGSAPVALQWYEGDASNFGAAVLLDGETGATLEVSNPTVDTRSFFVRATSAANESVNSNTVAVSFSNVVLVTGTTPANGATVVLPDSTITVTFSKPVKIQAGGISIDPAVPFTMSPGFDDSAFHTTFVLTPTSLLTTSTTYTVTVDNDKVTDEDVAGMTADYVFHFTTLVPVQITEDPQLVTVNAGQNAMFNVIVSGDGPYSFDWRRNDVSLGAPNSDTLILNSVSNANEGDYTVLVTGPGAGNFDLSEPAALNVISADDPVTLTGTSYTEDFNSIGSGLPAGWSVRTGADATALGTSATFLAAPTASTGSWGSTAGNFRNSASATALPSSADNDTQLAASNRALGMRQTGSVGDPGASFNFALNSTGKVVTGLSFAAQMLSVQTRSTIWSVQVGVGVEPSSWQTITTYNDPGTFGSTPIVINGALLASLADQPHVWIRIVALSGSSGGGSRDTFGIDDFVLTYEDDTDPIYWDANGNLAGSGGPSPAGIWGVGDFWSIDPAGNAVPGAWVPGGKAAFSAGSDATGDYMITLSGAQQASGIFFEEGNEIILAGAPLILSGLPRLDVSADVAYAAAIASEVQGSVGLIKTGPGILALLNPANSFSGLVSINAGALAISSDGALGNTNNDIQLGGLLGIMSTLSLNGDRDFAGAGGVVLLEDTALTINGSVSTAAFSVGAFVGDTGAVTFAGPVNTLGDLSFDSPATTPPPATLEITGQTLTVTDITVVDAGATVTVENEIIVPLSTANITVAAGSSLTLEGAISTPNSTSNNSLRKFGGGTLLLPNANPALHRVALGGQGAVPTQGGILQIDDKGALGVSQPFLNFGTLEIMTALTGAEALPNGVSISGRSGSPVVFAGEDLDIAGTNIIYGTADTSGNVVRLEVGNHTRFTGSFVNTGSIVPVDTLSLGGTGVVTLASPSFPYALLLSDTVTVEFDSEALAASASAATGLSVAFGATFHPGTDGGARVIAVSKNFTLEAGGTIVFDITGTGVGQFDALNLVTSGASHSAAGVIEVRFGAGYTPQAGHQFQILQWQTDANVTVSVESLQLPVLTAPLTWNTSMFEETGLLFIDGPGAGLIPNIIAQPQSQSVTSGDLVLFSVFAIGEAPLSYQWFYYDQPIADATSSSIFFNAGAGNAGLYRVVVTNNHGSATSVAAQLIVDDLPLITQQPQNVIAAENDPATFAFSAVGTITLIQWQFDGGSGFADLTDENGASLNLTAGAATYGSYRVILINENGQVTSFSATLTAPYNGPPTHAPEWNYSGDLPPGQIGLAYSVTPDVKPDDPANSIFRSAESFSATGLPAGLTINKVTGEISGIPAALKATPYNVKITARNKFGSTVLATRILINPLPTGVAGVFTGTVSRSDLLANVPNEATNGPLGGRIDFTVAATGKVSGKITIGAKVLAFRSAVTIDPLDATQVKMTAIIKRPKPPSLALTDIVINLTITGTGVLADASVTDGVAPAPAVIAGWRNPWSKINRADAIAGYYTLKLDLVQPVTPYTSAEAPLGTGYLSFTISPTTGKLTLKGKLADGSSITMATFAGPAGQMLMFRTLYPASARGSLLGAMEIEAMPDPLQNTIDGALEWWRPANLAKSNRLYRAGFPDVLDLDATGGRYVAPPKNVRVLGLTDADDDVEVLFTEAGVEMALPTVTPDGMTGTVALNNKVAFSPDPLINTRKAKLTFTAKTGAFKATIALSEENPLLPGSGKLVKRTVTGQGLIVGAAGEGYFILNQLPAVVGDTPANTPQLGGKVMVQPVPPVP